MGVEEHSTDVLYERGVRVTPQRAHVWRLLVESGGHLTAEEVWERVKETLPGTELSTVYRVLEALGEVNLVVDSRLPEGPRVFEASSSIHPHLVCERCGEITHPESVTAERLARVAGQNLGGFRVSELHLIAVGLCARCSKG